MEKVAYTQEEYVRIMDKWWERIRTTILPSITEELRQNQTFLALLEAEDERIREAVKALK